MKHLSKNTHREPRKSRNASEMECLPTPDCNHFMDSKEVVPS
ncbi:hypothetical protein WCP94_000437 (plasmid) [Bilophila wadsworthia]